jgi:BMFP domain-containing protein YqiC
MIDPKHLDDLAQKVAGSLPSGLQVLKEDMERNLRAVLEAALAKMDLVTREEFDVQSAVLARTREKLQRLEAQVAELERQAGLGKSSAE